MAREPERGDESAEGLAYYGDLASDPSTDPELLYEIANEVPSLRPAVAANPATYPDLVAWLAALDEPEVTAALDRRAASDHPPTDQEPAEECADRPAVAPTPMLLPIPPTPPAVETPAVAPPPPTETDAVRWPIGPPPAAPPPPPEPSLPPPPLPGRHVPSPPPPAPPGATGRRARRPARGRGLVVGGVIAGVTLAVGLGAAAVVLARPDPSIWIAAADDALLGRVALGDARVTATVDVATSAFEVISQDEDVVVYDTDASRLVVVDASTLDEVVPPIPVPVGSRVEVGGGVAAVLDSGAGKLWLTTVEDLGDLDLARAEPSLADLSSGARLAVGLDGVTHVVDPGRAALFLLDPDGMLADTDGIPLRGVSETDDLLVTAVGEEPIVLDRTNGRLYLPGSVVALATTTADSRVQRPGPATDSVLVATSSALVSQPLDGGAATVVRAGGESPPAPVFVDGCGYAAWHRTGAVVRDCPGDEDDLVGAVDVSDDTELRFRFDGGTVVLNDQRSGAAWRAADDLAPIESWPAGAAQ